MIKKKKKKKKNGDEWLVNPLADYESFWHLAIISHINKSPFLVKKKWK